MNTFKAIFLCMIAVLAGSCTTLLQTKNDLKMTDKSILISIDDGLSEAPDVDNTILDVLKKYEIKAAFCIIGRKIAYNKAVLNRILNEGHTIIWHAKEHELYIGKDFNTMLQEIEDFENTIHSLEQVDCTEKYKVRYIRPPNGILDTPLADKIKRQGFILVGASHYPTDPFFNSFTGRSYMEDTAAYFQRNGGGILVLHDALEILPKPSEADLRTPDSPANRSWVPLELEKFILTMRDHGFSFTSIDSIDWS